MFLSRARGEELQKLDGIVAIGRIGSHPTAGNVNMRTLSVEAGKAKRDLLCDLTITCVFAARHAKVIVTVRQRDLTHPCTDSADLVAVSALGWTRHVGDNSFDPFTGFLRTPRLYQRARQ